MDNTIHTTDCTAIQFNIGVAKINIKWVSEKQTLKSFRLHTVLEIDSANLTSLVLYLKISFRNTLHRAHEQMRAQSNFYNPN